MALHQKARFMRRRAGPSGSVHLNSNRQFAAGTLIQINSGKAAVEHSVWAAKAKSKSANLDVAKNFAALGAKLAICGRTQQKLDAAAVEFSALGAKGCPGVASQR